MLIVKSVVVEGCSKSTASEFFEIGKKGRFLKLYNGNNQSFYVDFDSNSDSMQANKVSLTGANSLMFIKLTILEGYDDFASIHYLDMV